MGLIPSATALSNEQEGLFNVRVSTRLPGFPNGNDIQFHCFGDDGHVYYCKTDSNGRLIRATEWIAYSLAQHLGLSVADYAILEDNDGETYFGSRSPKSVVSDQFALERFMRDASKDEVGHPSSWIGQMLARQWAFDLFIGNPDRTLQNFILDQDGRVGQIRAIDFASASLIPLLSGKFPIDDDATIRIGRFVRAQFGVHKAAAFELLDRIEAVPLSTLEEMIAAMPCEWLSRDQASEFKKVWANGQRTDRLNQLRLLIEHEW